ncbi:hypothetical protein [Streptomyces wuyuanensis]|uniref:hypothetical protein n=1 Tax=Streptomyces wuyuanensis TaxID=1196353 RepID=UPI00342CF9A5
MDRGNEFTRFSSGSGAPGIPIAPGLRLKRLRDELNSPVFAHRPRARTRRVVAYVRTLKGGDPAPLFQVLEDEASVRGWQVGHRLHDETGPLAPQRSPRWLQARKLMHEGFADGVLVLDRSHISDNDAEYETELNFVADRHCFTALVVPEAAT